MAMTPEEKAEKQRVYRERRKQEGYKQCNKMVKIGETIDPAKNRENGRIIAICEACDFIIDNNSSKIGYMPKPLMLTVAECLFEHFEIDREKAAATMEAVKETKGAILLITKNRETVVPYNEAIYFSFSTSARVKPVSSNNIFYK